MAQWSKGTLALVFCTSLGVLAFTPVYYRLVLLGKVCEPFRSSSHSSLSTFSITPQAAS